MANKIATPTATPTEEVKTGLVFGIKATQEKKDGPVTTENLFTYPDIEPNTMRALRQIVGVVGRYIKDIKGKKIVSIISKDVNVTFEAGSATTSARAVAEVAVAFIEAGGEKNPNLMDVIEGEEPANIVGANVLRALGLPVELFGGDTESMQGSVKSWAKGIDAAVKSVNLKQKEYLAAITAKRVNQLNATRQKLLAN
jgi:hypothetical protein